MNRGVRDSRCLVDWDKDRDTNLLSNYGMLCRVGIYRVYYYLVMVYYGNNIIWFKGIGNEVFRILKIRICIFFFI